MLRTGQPVAAGAAVSVKIFISCVSDEFRAYRDQLRTDLTRHNVEVKVQEDFKDQGGTTVENDDVYIRACDAVVHLVGDMTGAMAKPASTEAIVARYPDIKERFPPLRELLELGEEVSYTQWEAWLALYHGKPLLIAEAAEGAPRGPKFAPTVTSTLLQRIHLNRLHTVDRHSGCTFVGADQLAKYVLSSPVLDLLANERGGTTDRSACGAMIAGLLVMLAAPVAAEQWAKTLGVSIATPLALVLAVGSFVLALVYARYFGLLGASDGPAGSRDRQGYDALRENLATGGLAVRLYSRWLTAFLDGVDRFVGDADMADRTLLPYAFGLRAPAPLWTAPAFNRCLLLALLYPITTVVIMWVVSGHVGPAEEVLGLPRALPGWMRGVAVTALGLSLFGSWQWDVPTWRWISFVWFIIAVVFAVAVGGAGAVAGAVAIAFTIAFAFAIAIAGAGAGAVAVGGAFVGAVAGAVVGAVVSPVAATFHGGVVVSIVAAIVAIVAAV